VLSSCSDAFCLRRRLHQVLDATVPRMIVNKRNVFFITNVLDVIDNFISESDIRKLAKFVLIIIRLNDFTARKTSKISFT